MTGFCLSGSESDFIPTLELFRNKRNRENTPPHPPTPTPIPFGRGSRPFLNGFSLFNGFPYLSVGSPETAKNLCNEVVFRSDGNRKASDKVFPCVLQRLHCFQSACRLFQNFLFSVLLGFTVFESLPSVVVLSYSFVIFFSQLLLCSQVRLPVQENSSCNVDARFTASTSSSFVYLFFSLASWGCLAEATEFATPV